MYPNDYKLSASAWLVCAWLLHQLCSLFLHSTSCSKFLFAALRVPFGVIMSRDSKKDDNKKESKKKKKSKSEKGQSSSSSSSGSLDSISSGPSTVLDEVTSETEAAVKSKRRSSHGHASRTRSKSHSKSSNHKSAASKKKSVSSSNSSNSRAPRVASIDSSNLRANLQRSRIFNTKANSVPPKGRVRENALKTKVPNNQNTPLEASANDIPEKTILQEPVKSYNEKVREEFAARNVCRLAKSDCDPLPFLKPVAEDNVSESFLDRQVDARKVINFMVNHMTQYYDLEKDKDPFSKSRQLMDDQLWDTLAYLIPLLCRQMINLVRDEPLIVDVIPSDKWPSSVVFGDVHGNFNDVYHIYKNFITNPKYAHHRLIFLGDYVDRGPKPIEILCFLFAHKLVYPDRYVLLRGNHEVSAKPG